jgi:predicted kinase
MKTMVIMRGPPGSGKSSFVQYLREMCSGYEPTVVSLDTFRFVDGKYKFDVSRERQVIAEYYEAVHQALESGKGFIIIDNVNSRFWEFAKEKERAEKAGYRVFVVEVQADFWTCLDRMVHSVPFDKPYPAYSRAGANRHGRGIVKSEVDKPIKH